LLPLKREASEVPRDAAPAESPAFKPESPSSDRAYHSGNWAGLLRNPATVLASALACLVNGQGQILVPGLRPPPMPDNVRAALRTIPIGGGPDDPDIDEDWG
jgi:hypothetical protein